MRVMHIEEERKREKRIFHLFLKPSLVKIHKQRCICTEAAASG